MTSHIIVTGSSSGLGLALSKELLQKGCIVYGIDILPKHPELTSRSYVHHLCDLEDFDYVRKTAKQVGDIVPHIDALINCAGIMPTSIVARFKPEEAERTYKINVIAPLLLSKLFLKKLKAAHQGRIINITSIAADLRIPGEIVYASSKASLKHATSIMAIEFARYNVSVFDISPALILTPMTSHLTEDQCIEMRKKQSIPLEVTTKDFTEAVLKSLELPFSSTGSVIYVGGIA